MKAVCSWSGGKDAALALYQVLRRGDSITHLFTITSKDGPSHSHRIPQPLLQRQGESLHIPWRGAAAKWETYEAVFEENLQHYKAEGVDGVIFGDMDVAGHRDWNEAICSGVNMRALMPLWGKDQFALVKEFIHCGFTAIIVSLNTEYLPVDFLGEVLDEDLLQTFVNRGITPGGERGEYHTFVTGGPCFHEEIFIEKKSKEIDWKTGQAFLNISERK